MARVALVTGGSRGIGAAISVALKAAGYKVAANYAGNDDAAAAFTKETGIPTYKWSVADYDACVAGIAKVEAEVKVPDAKEPVFYTVKKGDNLWKISEHFYKNGAKHAVIFEANRPMLTHPDKIYPGQVLRIPDLG